MTDHDDPQDNDRPRPPARRGSPFDDGFVTLWQNADTGSNRAGKPDPLDESSDESLDTDESLLPDAWADGIEVLLPNPADDDTGPTEIADEPPDIATEALRDEEAVAERAAAHAALRPVLHSLQSTGLYAYITLDEENRWTVASDDERGRVDIRLDDGDYEVAMSATSPGMYADEDQPFRRRSLERLARMLIPRVARGQLAEHQSASWDEVDAGVAVRVRYVLPRERPEDIGPFVQEHFEELEELLSFIEVEISR